MKKHIIIFVCILCLSLVLYSCRDIEKIGDSEIQYEGEYATALFTSRVSVEEIVKNIDDAATSSYFDSEGLLHLNYEGDIFAKTSQEFFTAVPDITLPQIDTFFSVPYPTSSGTSIELVKLKGSEIAFQCTSNSQENVSLYIEFPQIKHPTTNAICTYNANISALGTISDAISLDGWNLSPNETGQIEVRYVALLPNGNRVRFDDFSMSFNHFQASYLQGYLGLSNFNIPRDTINIDFFKQWVSGGIAFKKPSISLKVENAMGIPIKVDFQAINIENVDGSTFTLESDIVTNGLNINYPSLNEVGEAKQTDIVFDGDNSNIGNVFSQKPLLVDYQINAIGNPDEDESIAGFVTDTSYFKIKAHADLPIYAQTDMLTIQAEVDAVVGNDYEFAESIELKIVSDNKIPLEAGVQMYFKDGNGVILDSLFDMSRQEIMQQSPLVKSAPTDDNGYSNGMAHHEAYIEVEKSKFTAISQMKKMSIYSIFNNPNNKAVRFLKGDDVSIKVGMKAKIKQ